MKPGAVRRLVRGLALLPLGWASASNSTHSLEASAASSPRTDPSECDCFTVAGPDPGYFQHYKLWDFRSVPLDEWVHSGHRDWTDDEVDVPTAVNDEDGHGTAVDEDEHDPIDHGDGAHAAGRAADALWFFETAFDKDWVSQKWQRPRTPQAPVTMINSKRNVFFTRNWQKLDERATYLVLRTTRHWDHTTTSEIETTVRNIFRCSLRVRLRILPSNLVVSQPHDSPSGQNKPDALNGIADRAQAKPHPGACVGIFTYRAHNCESDIEILTKDPPYRVHYANQPDYDAVKDAMIPGASTVADLPVSWTTWSTHRLDWLSTVSRWWVNNEPQDAKTYRVPDLPSRLVVNLWSDGGFWTGDLRPDESVLLAIEYIELAYNTSSSNGWQGSENPSSEQHVGNASLSDVDGRPDHSWELGAEIIDGSTVKKCKKGRKGRKCRKNRKKHGKKPKRPPSRTPSPRCERACNIDDLGFAHGGLRT